MHKLPGTSSRASASSLLNSGRIVTPERMPEAASTKQSSLAMQAISEFACGHSP